MDNMMSLRDFEREMLYIIRQLDNGGDARVARQRLSALHTNLMRAGRMTDAAIIRKVMRGMR